MMKILLFALLGFAIAHSIIGHPHHIRQHNKAFARGEVKWEMAVKPVIGSLEELKSLCRANLDDPNPLPMKEANAVKDIPDTFDSREEWPQCADMIGHIFDQGHCGSCWAMGAFEALEDRICIQTQGASKIWLSPQDLVSCDHSSMGCNGGWPSSTWQTLKNTGIVTEACYPYAMGTCHHPGCSSWPTPNCNQTCVNGADFRKDKHFASTAYSVPSRVQAIQQEIMEHGPVEAAFTVYEDFANYKSGVYHHVSGSTAGGHAIKIIGWGVDNGTPYWNVVNSWATDWGMGGYFWILRGKNECGIESQVVAGLARV